jgi:hypothetical protein
MALVVSFEDVLFCHVAEDGDSFIEHSLDFLVGFLMVIMSNDNVN